MISAIQTSSKMMLSASLISSAGFRQTNTTQVLFSLSCVNCSDENSCYLALGIVFNKVLTLKYCSCIGNSVKITIHLVGVIYKEYWGTYLKAFLTWENTLQCSNVPRSHQNILIVLSLSRLTCCLFPFVTEM